MKTNGCFTVQAFTAIILETEYGGNADGGDVLRVAGYALVGIITPSRLPSIPVTTNEGTVRLIPFIVPIPLRTSSDELRTVTRSHFTRHGINRGCTCMDKRHAKTH